MCDKKNKTICLTGGGSGGHIYPALAIAEELSAIHPDVKIVLIGAKRGLEKTIFKKTSYKSYFLPVGQLHSSVGRLTQMWSLVKMPYCFLKSFFILLKHRPLAVMGVGGYASGPLCLTSVFLKIPTYVWEGNATPGVTNKILGRFKVLPFLVFKEASKYFKKVEPILTGVPVRKNLEETSLKSKLLAEETSLTSDTAPLLENKRFRVLFVGGSQGARIFNETLPEYVKTFGLDGFHFTHQTGLKNFESVMKNYSKSPNLDVLAYLDPIVDYYLKADLIVSRSGAGAVNEFSLLSKASVLVPFPKASDNHQLKNAESLVSKKSALIIEESDFTPLRLNAVLLKLKSQPELIEELETNVSQSLKRGARQEIAAHLAKHL